MGLDFPSKIVNSPEFEPVLSKVFPYYADVYDLEAYEGLKKGFGKAIWNLVCAEKDLQAALRRFNKPSLFERLFG